MRKKMIPCSDQGAIAASINAWIAANNYEVGGPVEELYFNNPAIAGEEPLTEIRFPIRKK